ncbi:adenylosuccinate lyase [Halobacteriales archaeon SW_5_70_135]|nr:MAG: adenylosuccinate lyase [Halobacteriales archaeon SW_5_70_135]
MPDPLHAVSPLDGRYADRLDPLREYASEAALVAARVRVEVEYLLALADHEAVALSLSPAERDDLRAVVAEFDDEDARLVKRIETEGYDDYAATNHDVKAVEYFLRERTTVPEEWIHFGLTSEDVNNLAYRLLVRGAVREVLVPELRAVRDELADLAREHRGTPMLARTHGQPATPTTFGKETAVYAARLGRAVGRTEAAVDDLTGKVGGATGTLAAHHAAYPETDWRAFAREFVAGFDLRYAGLTTQVNPCDDLAALFDAVDGANAVLTDLDRDAWLYVSEGYLRQRASEGETGSSTMPHKVNPIDFENGEGNLAVAAARLDVLADRLPTSRLQRDLSDSTVKRTIGVALGHAYLGYRKTRAGLEGVAPDAEAMREDLRAHPEVLTEAVQTVLRREGHADAYERVKTLTRGRTVDLAGLRAAIRDLAVDEAVREELLALAPESYTGLADETVDDLDDTTD